MFSVFCMLRTAHSGRRVVLSDVYIDVLFHKLRIMNL